MSKPYNKFNAFDGHELVREIHDEDTGLHAVIAIHSTTRGPAAGGTRFKEYQNWDDAVEDALKLSKAMSYKSALAHVPFGGGKAVINAKGVEKTEALLEAYGRFVESFDGSFLTGPDMGIDLEDTKVMARQSKNILGIHGADTGYYAGLGVFYAIEAAVEKTLNVTSLEGIRVSIKGLGKVGASLAELLSRAGAHVTVADMNPEAVRMLQEKLKNISTASPEDIHTLETDVYSPCAVGGELNQSFIKELRCRIVAGGANNQLADSDSAQLMKDKGILYVPDYIANSGGLIAIVDERGEGGYDDIRVQTKLKTIKDTLATIIDESVKTNKNMSVIADTIAEKAIHETKS